MKRLIAVTVALLAGCTLGSTRMGEEWAKDGASSQERAAALSDCTQQMREQKYGAEVSLSDNIAARKQFSRDCMNAKGWSLPTAYARVPPPPPSKRWYKDDATEADYRVQLARCRMQVANLPIHDRPQTTATSADAFGAGIGRALEQAAQTADDVATRDRFMNNCFTASGWDLR